MTAIQFVSACVALSLGCNILSWQFAKEGLMKESQAAFRVSCVLVGLSSGVCIAGVLK